MQKFSDQFKQYNIENYGYIRLPKIDISKEQKEVVGLSENATNCEFLLQLARNGFKKKQNKIKRERWKEYGDRVKTEISLLDELGFIDYILLVWLVNNKAKEAGAFIDFGRGCLNGDTSVFTDRGPIRINEVLIGDKVLTTSNTYEDVIDVFEYNCNEKLIKINTWMKTVNSPSMTLDHKVLAIRDPFINLPSQKKKRPTVIGISPEQEKQIFRLSNAEWIPAKEIKKGDYLLESEYDNFIENKLSKIDLFQYGRSFDWGDEEYYYELKGHKEYFKGWTVKTKRFIEIDNDFLYILGFFIGDGWFKRSANEIGFAFHSEDNIKEYNFIKKYFENLGCEISTRNSKKRKLTQLIIKSYAIKGLFSNLVPNYCDKKIIPKEYLFLNNIKTEALLNGLLDSDGSHCDSGRISFDSTSPQLILQVKLLAKRLGYRTSVTSRNQINCNKSFKIRLYPIAEKKKHYKTITNDGFFFKKVISTELVDNPSNKVYDIHVKNNHNYHTEDYIVHNSCAGSLINYLIGISGVDPIEKELFFERFVSRARADKKIINGEVYLRGELCPDIDSNLSQYRELVVNWLREVYPNRVSKIINFSTLTTRILLKDVSKIYAEYSEDQAKEVSDMIGSKFGVVQEIDEAYKENEKFKQWVDNNKDIVSISKKLSGLIRQTSVHASGYLVSFYELTDIIPLELSKEGDLVSGYDMRQVSNFAIKLDLLGLTTNGIIKDILSNIPETVEDMNLDSDPVIYDQYQSGNLLPYGLYQISAHCAYGVLNKVKPKTVDELSDVNSLARPGSLAYVDSYVKGDAKVLNPVFEPILKKTRSVVLFQEQIMQLATVLGFTLTEAELIRKISGKKELEKVKEWEEKIYKKAKENGFSEEVSAAYWKLVKDSASYSFNKCASLDESVITKNGIKYLYEINIGDEVLAYDTINKKDHYVKVKDVIRGTSFLHTWGLTSNTSIKCSANHKFLTKEVGMIRMYDIFLNNYTIIGKDNREFKVLNSIVELKDKEDCIDLEVESEDHNFYCNNLVTSNSHSVATAYLSALTTYLKYKYPLQFYTSCLKGTRELADPIGEIHEIVKELPYFGIKLLPPDIIKSDLDFKIEDGNIRFGLSHIKGISGATIEKLLNFRRESTTTKFQLFEVAQQCSIPINVLAGLIYCGCLDGKGQNRARLVLEAQTYNILTEKEKILVHKLSADYNEDLLTIIKELTTRNDEKGKPYIKESRFGTIKKKYDPYKQIYLQNSRNEELCSYIMERIFLGFSYTSSLQKIYESKYKGLKSIKDCNSEPKDVYCKFGGFITEIKKGKTKAKSTPYIKVQLSDETGGCQIMMFGEDKIKNIENFHGKELEEDQIIIVEGKSVGENTYFADCIFIQDIPIKLKVSEINKDIKI